MDAAQMTNFLAKEGYDGDKLLDTLIPAFDFHSRMKAIADKVD